MNDLVQLFYSTGLLDLSWQMMVMWAIVVGLLYLAVAKGFEPLLLIPIAFGALLANLPTEGILNKPADVLRAPQEARVLEIYVDVGDEIEMPRVPHNEPQYYRPYTAWEEAGEGHSMELRGKVPVLAVLEVKATYADRAADGSWQEHVYFNDAGEAVKRLPIPAEASGEVTEVFVAEGQHVTEGERLVDVYSEHAGGLFYYFELGILLEIFPPIIFLGVGALTDFGPLIANPRTLLLGAAAQFGVFATFAGAILIGFTPMEAGAIGIIGGADGPTSIFLSIKLAPHLLGPIAVAAYSYMALVPVIQPPIMRALTTKAERSIRMRSLRRVSKLEKLIFAVMVMVFCIIIVPAASALIGMLLFGNFLRECGVTERLSKAAQNEIINVVTIFLGASVGIQMTGERFLAPQTVAILALGIVAFVISTSAGILMAKVMNLVSKEGINPLIGSAGVSAVPMAARVSQVEGQKADPGNFLLMHAMGPNVAGVIGTAVAAGIFISYFAG